MAAPKYLALASELRKEVLSGRYGPEGGLPSAPEIAKKYGVVINTVKTALAALAGEGLIAKRGAGYFVNGIQTIMTQHVPLPTARLQPREGYVKTIRVTVGPLPDYIASKLNHSEFRDIPFREQVSGEMNGHERPLQVASRYYFLTLSDAQVDRLRQEPGWDPMWELQRTLQSRDEISSRPATNQEAEQLSLPTGTSIIALWEVIRDPDGKLLMAQELTLSPRETLIFEFAFENKPS